MSMNFKTAEELVSHLELQRHVEGGYYRETYRAKEVVETARGPRNSMTNIYYCLPSDDFSVWHKLVDLEETFHYHWGDSALIYKIVDGKIVTEILGPSGTGEQTIVMPANTWFAIRPSGLKSPAAYTLMSCSVVPGFEFEDLVIGDKAILDELDESEHKLAISLIKAQNR
jgi:predicted cupin superfamily sugar epimerase